MCIYSQRAGSCWLCSRVDMIATLYNVLLNLTLFYVYRACVTVVEHFGRIRYLLDLYGAVKPGECSSVDWQESEMLNGFKISYNPSQQR